MSYLKSNDLFKQIPTEALYQQVPRPMLIADHLMTPDNLGAMIRLADNIGATEVCFLGREEEHRLGKVRRAAASSRDNIRWYFSEETDLHNIVPQGKTIVAIETADNATCIYDTPLPEDAAFIVGSERDGLSDALLRQCDQVVYIPVPGPTRSLNVSHAAAVALFEWQRQMLSRPRPARHIGPVAMVLMLFLMLTTSCHRNDPFIGRWTVEKVNVEFDEYKVTPEMVRQTGEMERNNIIDIGKDSVLTFISDGDTLRGQCSLKGTQLFLEGKPFGRYEEGLIETITPSPLGMVKVCYRR